MLDTSPLHRLILDNGITLIVNENPTTDLIAGRLFFKNAGSCWESLDQAGLSHLLATLLTKGTTHQTAVEIAETVESMGASLGADVTNDYFYLSLKSISADFSKLLALASDIVRSPLLPPHEISLEKELTQRNIRSQLEQPFNVAFSQLRSALYPDHPYGFSVLGTQETVANLSQEDLFNYHRTHFRPDHLIISLSGRITLEKAQEIVSSIFAPWEVPNTSFPTLELSTLSHQPSQQQTTQETQQSIVMLGYLSASVKDEDYPILKLLSTYLGNGLSSRLFVELREKKGLAYDVSAFYPTRLDLAPFIMYMGTAPENTQVAIEGLQAEADRLCQQELSPIELKAAKNKLLGQYALGKQTNGEIAQLNGWYETLELGLDYDQIFQDAIAAITAEQIHAIAQKYLQSPYLSLVGPMT
ncbi:MAG: M16 family metallopeptidase [Microcystaceae cyanobacterium]